MSVGVDPVAGTGAARQTDVIASASRIQRIDHIGVAVEDADAAVATYLSLGLSVFHDETLHDVGVRLVYLGPGDRGDRIEATAVQVVQPVGPGAVQRWMAEHGPGIHHICFAVDDVAAFTRSAAIDESAVFRGGRDRRACFIPASLHGAIIELTDTDPFPGYAADLAPDTAEGTP